MPPQAGSSHSTNGTGVDSPFPALKVQLSEAGQLYPSHCRKPTQTGPHCQKRTPQLISTVMYRHSGLTLSMHLTPSLSALDEDLD